MREKNQFDNKFTCLRSFINFMLDDSKDVECRISKATKVTKEIRVLNFIWDKKDMQLEIKYALRNAISLNLLLQGSESQSGNMMNIKKNEVF